MKKKIAVFTGAGISAESGISTFRDIKDGLWYNYKVDDVATIEGWRKDRAKVLEFHNMLRSKLPTVEPNDAHRALAALEQEYDVTIITQNVDNLHERGGSTNIIHLHGELTKARGCMYDHKSSEFDEVHDIGYKEINMGDKCPITGSQLRPHIVWFGEYPFGVHEAYQAVEEADILMVIGTSLQISYTLDMLNHVSREGDEVHGGKPACKIYYIDPNPMNYLTNYGLKVEYIRKKASEGVVEVVNNLLVQANGGLDKEL
jgi:NAD-dependent deacetylase